MSEYQRYPDLLNNPDGDPRVYQEQYERWHEWDEAHHQNEQEPEPSYESIGGEGI